MRKCIINVATGRHIKGQERLRNSLIKHGFDGDFLGWNRESDIKAPPHSANPYAFKTYAFEEAFSMGYDLVLWLDASVVAKRNIDYVFNKIQEQGYIMQEAGHMVGTWSNDNQLNYFGITRDKAMHLPMYGNAGLLGLNRESDKAMEFLKQWHEASKAGLFIGSWKNDKQTESKDYRCKGSRHDMSVGSIISSKLKMKFEGGNELLHYAPPEQEVKDNVYFHAQGV